MKLNIDQESYIFTKVFTKNECDTIINDCEIIQFIDIQTNKLNQTFIDTEFRNDKCCTLINSVYNELIYTKLQKVFPGDYILNDIIRVSKYEKDSYCKSHKDGIIATGRGDTRRTNKFSVILYLNKCEGGETILHTNPLYTITPSIGDVLVFDPNIIHESNVCQSLKYCLRTELMYITPTTQTKETKPRFIKYFTNGKKN